MEVKLKPSGCADKLGCVLSFGLLPLLAMSRRKQTPSSLTEQEMILTNGQHIPWSNFTHVQATDVYLNRGFIGTRYVLKHTGGKVAFGTDKIANAEDTVRFIRAHLPAQVVWPSR